MKLLFSVLALIIVLTTTPHARAETFITSIYTDLADSQCEIVKLDQETGNSVHKCPGVGGFHLLIDDDDNRMSVRVVAPDNKEHPLDYWNVITHSFSHLGKRAEWRVLDLSGQITPIALIIRVDAYGPEDVTPRKQSYLAVAKITGGEICVSDRIRAAVGADEQARKAADQSVNQKCMKPQTFPSVDGN
jgi:hypothetical protein